MEKTKKAFLLLIFLDSIFALVYFINPGSFLIPAISASVFLLLLPRLARNVTKYDIDFLFLLSISATLLFSVYATSVNERPYFEVSMLLCNMYLVSKLVERKAMERAEESFSDLFEMLPKKVIVIKRGKQVEIGIGEINVGDRIILNPGKKVPADGKILSGFCSVNERMITGESADVEKRMGDRLIAGTILTNGSVKMSVEKVGEGTYLSQILGLVREAQKAKTNTTFRIEKTYRKLVTGVIVSSFLCFLFWRYLFPQTLYISLRNSISVLVVSSNASLVLATPLTLIFSVTNASKKGIIMKRGQTLEDFSRISTYIFDKTGTLTFGTPKIIRVRTFGSLSENEVIAMAASAEKSSPSGIGKTLVEEAGRRRLKLRQTKRFSEQHGSGVFCKIVNKEIYVGTREFMQKNQIKSPRTNGINGNIFVAVDGRLEGAIEIMDEERKGSRDLMDFLKSKNKDVVMLTGDTEKIARATSESLSIRKFHWGLSPEKKLKIVEGYQKRSRIVMVGDGINDAPALAMADVGISIDTDNDLASETADVVLLKNDISLIKHLFLLSEEAEKKIRQNFFWTYLYNSVAVIVVGGGLFLVAGYWVDPLIASAASISSGLSVLLNSMSLRNGFHDS
ncbi:hypothetical protein A3K63_03980 [Candidatus Micrarchaeota archaeon RBG_16_49_10]|nr:MAG: hypothetical protein A3K63_03980 [Candidatus Micrarchaeota archaeon RBG_16_49_10]